MCIRGQTICSFGRMNYICSLNQGIQFVMITFKPIELDDKDMVQKYTLRSWRRNCDMSFSNLYSWRFLYRTHIAEKKGF